MTELGKCYTTGKVCHPTKAAAKAVMKEVSWRRKSFDLQVYSCDDCKKWHFGHNRGRLAKRIRYTLKQARRERES